MTAPREEGLAPDAFERIEVEIHDEGTGLRYRKAFQGRWVIRPDSPYVAGRGRFYAVARTRRNRIAFFHFGEGPDELIVYDTLEQAARTLPIKLVAAAAAALGQRTMYVEELDI